MSTRSTCAPSGRWMRTLVTLSLSVLLLAIGSAARATGGGRPDGAREAADGSTPLPALSVELHSHLFMKQGLGWLFRGDFAAPEAASSWRDRLSSKASPATVQRSGIGLLVVAIFAHPLAHLSLRASVRAQITAARRFAARHPPWQLVRSAAEARRVLQRGGRAMVLAIEGAAGVLDSEDDLRELVDRQGVAIVTPLHLVDDRYGGVATLNGFQYLGNPLGLADRLLDPHCNAAGPEANARGLTARGRRLVAELLARGVWIDLSHASDVALRELLPMLRAAGQPPLFTHVTLRRFRPAERAISDAVLHQVAAQGGVVGLVPTEDAFVRLRVPPRYCPRGCPAEQCAGSVSAFATMYAAAAAVLGPEAVVLGSDHNGGMRHLAPACGTGTSLDRPAGLHSIGQSAELWDALRTVGAPVPALSRSLARVLDTWERVKPVRLAAAGLPPWPRHATGGAALRGRLAAGMGTAARHLAPGPELRADLRVSADGEAARLGEPDIYFARSRLDVLTALGGPALPYLDARLSPFGIGVRRGDNRLWGEVLQVRLGHHRALDEAFRLELSALAGALRTTPAFAERAGEHDLFIELSADLLGYRRTAHLSSQPTIDALHTTGGTLGMGATFHPNGDARLTVAAHAGADLDLSFAGGELASQSDVDLGGRVSLLFASAAMEPFFEAGYLSRRESSRERPWRGAPRFAGGLAVGLP